MGLGDLDHRLGRVRREAEHAEQDVGLREVLAQQAHLVGDGPHEAARVVLVEDRVVQLVAQQVAVPPQHAVGHVVERAAPEPADALADEALRAVEHLARGAVGERQQQNPARVDAPLHEVRHAVRQRAGLARAGGRDDQHRPVRRPHRRELFGIQGFLEINRAHKHEG